MASSEFTNLLTENEILKASLDQLANEKVSLVGQLRGAQDQAAIRAQEESQAVASFQVSYLSFGWTEKMTSWPVQRWKRKLYQLANETSLDKLSNEKTD